MSGAWGGTVLDSDSSDDDVIMEYDGVISSQAQQEPHCNAGRICLYSWDGNREYKYKLVEALVELIR